MFNPVFHFSFHFPSCSAACSWSMLQNKKWSSHYHRALTSLGHPNATLPACWCLLSRIHYYERAQREETERRQGSVEDNEWTEWMIINEGKKNILFCYYTGFWDKKTDERRMTGTEPKEQGLSSNARSLDNLKEQASVYGRPWDIW